jgi:hypothetical protein
MKKTIKNTIIGLDYRSKTYETTIGAPIFMKAVFQPYEECTQNFTKN